MQGKHSFLALSTAFAALFVGCEWTGSSESDSWSSAYDAMNFSGSYRAVTTATQVSTTTTTDKDTSTVQAGQFYTTSQNVGAFPTGVNTVAGQTVKGNLVPGSFQASAGNYVWNDDGSGKLVFTNPNSGASQSDDSGKTTTVQAEAGPQTDGLNDRFAWNLKHAGIKSGTVSVVLSQTEYFSDNGDGTLSGPQNSYKGKVNYDSGEIWVEFPSEPPAGKQLTVSYTYSEAGTSVVSSDLSGSGTIQYSSGAWTLQINPAMTKTATIMLRYSYYAENSDSTGGTTTTITTTTGNEVSALTVSQNGQNLTITLNNGIVMTGKFTNVQQTGKVNQDTNAGYNTYNAQFQVQTTDSKMVGSLNYDLQNGYRMMNGTWTWGKNSYDVQAVGPAWLNSADASTLSPGVLTK